MTFNGETEEHILPAGDDTLEFTGRLIAVVDNDRGDRPRWAELRLYKVSGERRLWLLYTIGHSLVYHQAGSDCKKGIRMAAGDFRERAEDWRDLEGCEHCSPPDWGRALPGTEFDLEVTWYTHVTCRTPDEVYCALLREPRCKNCLCKPHDGQRCRRCRCAEYAEAPRVLSVPGRRLWENARRADPDLMNRKTIRL
jgi:hypothetical protein